MLLLASFNLAVAVTLIVILVRARLSPKVRLVVCIAAALVIPLFALWLFLVNGYHHWAWTPFEYGSWVPHALAGLATLALLATALVRTTGSILTRLAIGVLAFWLWLFFWLCGSFIVTCSMGDCI